jgi:hypothetical protein
VYWLKPDRIAAIRLAAALALLAASSMCFGKVYRCAAKDGSILYSDSPCGPDAEVVPVKPAARAGSLSSKVSPRGNVDGKQPMGCAELDQLDNSRIPPDLYLGLTACIQQDNYRAAVAIFALAGMDSRFDAARVIDKTAGQAGQILIAATFDGLPAEKRDKFAKTVRRWRALATGFDAWGTRLTILVIWSCTASTHSRPSPKTPRLSPRSTAQPFGIPC